jgi:hypothetical protein
MGCIYFLCGYFMTSYTRANNLNLDGI